MDRSNSACNRRSFVKATGALVGAGFLSPVTRFMPGASAQEERGALFALGVASGDPGATDVTIWTRLVLDPLDAASLSARVSVRYEVATDDRMRRIVARGSVAALPEAAHSVHVRVQGLSPDRWYYYRFYAQGQASRVGRTRTFPGPRDNASRLRFALASCQDYQNGYYSAYAGMLDEDIDCVVHVGDYIYEYGTNTEAVRQVPDDEITTLADYRNRYALYRLDASLADVHAAFPFIVTWDDHEVDNNYAGDVPEDDQTPEAFRARRAAAYQAYYEHMPLMASTAPRGPEMRLYRSFQFGSLAELNVLDTRQFRTDQPCGDGFTYCPEVLAPEATLTGSEQLAWLKQNLTRSRSTWNVLAQQVMMTKWDGSALTNFQSPLFNVDAWDGYQAARDELLKFIADQRIANPIVLTGDIHSSWAADLKLDFTAPNARVVATEFVSTSITSDFPASLIPQVQATLPTNPHIKFFEAEHRGYALCEVTPRTWTTRFRAVASITAPESSLETLASFVVERDRPGAQRA